MRLEVGRIQRRSPYEYATSWPLEELVVVRDEGDELRLLLKHLGHRHAGKPPFLCDPQREIEAYALLDGEQLGTARCYASGRWWLALERVDGVELWQRADIESWEATARWTAALHERFRAQPPAAAHLLRHDRRFYRRWYVRARAIGGAEVDALAPAARAAIERLIGMPRTLIHGELYPSNVLIASSRVAAVDWEMAAIGPGVIDLAALVTGWHPAAQARITRAYGEVDPRDLAAAQLLLALQWLGWAVGWDPPREHRHDWLAEARRAAEALVA